MKTLFFLALLPFSAHAMTCEQEVERIRAMPAKLITVAQWDKMMNGCPKKEAPKFEDTCPMPPNYEADQAELKKLREENEFYKSAYTKLVDIIAAQKRATSASR